MITVYITEVKYQSRVSLVNDLHVHVVGGGGSWTRLEKEPALGYL